MHEQDLSVSAKEIRNVSKRNNTLFANMQNKCVDMKNVLSSSTKLAIHLGPKLFGEFGDLQEHKIRGD